MAAYENRYWTSADGLKLHYRYYPGDMARAPLLCLPGLTRNARDYDALAARMAGSRQILAINLRGRGGSEYARDTTTYVPATYVEDVRALIDELALTSVVAIGTSLGGIVTMLLKAAGAPIAGAIINDVGPDIDPRGLARIRSYVGRGSSFPTWMHAARAVQDVNADVYPDWGIEEWLAMAKRLYRLTGNGRIVLDYDLKIAEPIRAAGGGEDGPDLWAALTSLRTDPVLIVRGGRSDVLTAATAERMHAALDCAELVTVPGVGHTPTLVEPMLHGPIDRLLARVDG